MNEILEALLKAASLGYAFGMGKTGYDQFTITLLDCRTHLAHEQVLPADHLEQLPQVIDFLIAKFEDPQKVWKKFPVFPPKQPAAIQNTSADRSASAQATADKEVSHG